MAVDLQNNNFELVRASWTAMDQTYGTIKVGYTLQPIDNSGQGKTQPWQTPSGYVVVAVIEDAGLGGKFTLYKNEQTNTVLLNAIGTNGNADPVGWYTNLKDFGLSQWRSAPANEVSVKERTFSALNDIVDSNSKIVVNGDSKGMALANFVVYDLVKDRDLGVLDNSPSTKNLSNLTNENIAIVGRVGPGVQDILAKDDANFSANLLILKVENVNRKLLGSRNKFSVARISEFSPFLFAG